MQQPDFLFGGGRDAVEFRRIGRLTPMQPRTFGGDGPPVMRLELCDGSSDAVPTMPVIAQLTGGHPLARVAAQAVVKMGVNMLASGRVHCALGLDTIGVEFDESVTTVTGLVVLNSGEGGRTGTVGLSMGPVCPPDVCRETLHAQVRAGNPASQMYATLYATLSIATALVLPMPTLYSTVPDVACLLALRSPYDVASLATDLLPEMAAHCAASGFPVACY
jgi:hypothetical protein